MASPNPLLAAASVTAGNGALQAMHGAQAAELSADPLGGSSRLAQLLDELETRLAERHAFDVFAKDSINFGIMVTYRQTWEPQQYQVGDLVSDDPARARRRSGATPRAR